MMMVMIMIMTTTAAATTTVRVQNLVTKVVMFCSSLFNLRLPYESEDTVAPTVRRLPLSQWRV